jgi:hypothetical protein
MLLLTGQIVTASTLHFTYTVFVQNPHQHFSRKNNNFRALLLLIKIF